MLFLLMLLQAAPIPVEWAEIADITPTGIAQSAAQRCVGDGCQEAFKEDVRLLATAWNSPAGQFYGSKLMLDAIRENTDAKGTDWHAARLTYTERYLARRRGLDADAARVATAPAPSASFVTECRTVQLRYSSSTTCTTTQR